jgi:putative membrane protein
MKIFSSMILLSLAVFGLTGCPGNATNTAVTNTNTNTGSAATTNSNANAMNSNANAMNSNANAASTTTGDMTSPNGFMTEAARGGMAEVELSRTAQTKAQNAEVKAFAQKMVQDHSNANTEIKALAAKKNVTLPTEMDAAHKTMAETMAKLSGAEFDKAYVNAMVADHEKSVALFQTQANSGTDADAKALAAKTLPTLKMHLDMIKGIQGKLK